MKMSKNSFSYSHLKFLDYSGADFAVIISNKIMISNGIIIMLRLIYRTELEKDDFWGDKILNDVYRR